MSVKHILIQTCQLIILLNFTQTYMLFAANLDDFRSIAKKFVPDGLADQLAAIALQNSAKYKQQIKKKHIERDIQNLKLTTKHDVDYNYEEEIKTTKVAKKNEDKRTTLKMRFSIKDKPHGIDFDELVNRVKQQIEEKYKHEFKTNKKNNEKDDYSEESEGKITRPNKNMKRVKSKIALNTIKTTTENAEMYNDDVTEAKPAAKVESQFQEDDLTKLKDSYEDYERQVKPNKDDIFESDAEPKGEAAEEAEAIENKDAKRTPPETKYKEENEERPKATDKTEYTNEEEYEYDNHKSEEVKAQTGRILDDPDKNSNDKKMLKGTMIPTREYFKMSSPNYAVKIPVLAEKYDFNEPLPEKDREPENLKYIAIPELTVNKKVKV